jgi:hypothetical protein
MLEQSITSIDQKRRECCIFAVFVFTDDFILKHPVCRNIKYADEAWYGEEDWQKSNWVDVSIEDGVVPRKTTNGEPTAIFMFDSKCYGLLSVLLNLNRIH